MGIRKQTKVWTTAVGTKIRICDMSDQHLMNAAKMLRRKAFQYLGAMESWTASMSGDMAQYYADAQMDRLVEMPTEEVAEDLFPIAENLHDELRRRGLYQKYEEEPNNG